MSSTIGAVARTEPSGEISRLVSRAHAGDRDAREALAGHVGRTAYVLALQLTRDPGLAEDVAQDSVIRFFRRIGRFDTTRALQPWVHAIVRNRVRDLARAARVRRHESLDRWIERGEPADPTADPAGEAERHDLQRRVWAGISRLSDQHREILVLRDFHDLAYREIAHVLGIPDGTVMSRLHAARRSLRELLATERTD